MDYLFKDSLEMETPIELIYMKDNGEISQRTVIIRKIYEGHILAFCMSKQGTRSFKFDNILSVAKPRFSAKYKYA